MDKPSGGSVTRTVTHIGATQQYWYDANGNQSTRKVNSQTFNLSYDAENRLVTVSGAATASFVYDGDGKRVQSTVGGVTTTFVGSHYEVTGSTVTKYYFAGASRVAMRKYTIPSSMSVEYMLGDHLGSTSITTDTTGAKVSEIRYKPWGEVRYSWTAGLSTTPAYKLNSYTFTGQYSYMDDPSTTGVTEGFGLLFYNARFYDPAVGRFISADSIVPGGVQGYDRYAYTNNNPVRYTDPSGHRPCGDGEDINCDGTSNDPAPNLPGCGGSGQQSCGGGGGGGNDDDLAPDPNPNGVGEPLVTIGPMPPSSYCGGGTSGWYNFFDCGANITQDLALAIDVPFAGVETAFLAVGCFAGLEGCAAAALAGQVFFGVTGANAAETALSGVSTIFSIFADATDGEIGEGTYTAVTTVVLGTLSQDPILDAGIDGYGSGYNHDVFNGISSFFDPRPVIR